MKLTAILLTVFFLQVRADGLTQSISFSGKDVPLEKVLDAINKQSGYVFFYKENILQEARPVTINIKNVTVEEAVRQVLKDQPLDFYIKDRTVVISKKKEELKQENSPAPTPPLIDIRGRVLNDKGEPVQASISVKGTPKGTATNKDGWFVLQDIEENAVLVISGVGIETTEVKADGKTQLEIAVRISAKPLDEIQMIAYGTTTKRFSTGNIASVKAKDLETQPVSNPLLALQGRVPGLTITQSSGVPGSGVTVRIQGKNSINAGNDPLYIVDGVPYPSQMLPTTTGGTGTSSGIFGTSGGSSLAPGGNGNPLSFIGMENIESIEVLKDADATSIYGSRGANGVILITTKKGNLSKRNSKVDLNFQQGWGKVTRTIDMMSTAQYLEMRNEAMSNDGLIPSANPADRGTAATGFRKYAPDIKLWDSTRYTDWQKELIGGTAHYTDANGSISGGNPNLNYRIGGGYHRETTVFPGDFDFKRGNANFSLNSQSQDRKFSLQFSANYINSDNNLPSADFIGVALSLPPNAPSVHNPDGSLNWAPNSIGNSSWDNPLAQLYSKYETTTENLISSFNVGYKFTSDLEFKIQMGYNRIQTEEFSGSSLLSQRPEFRAFIPRSAQYTSSTIKFYLAEPQLNYKRSFGKVKIDVLFGSTIQQNQNKGEVINGSGYPTDDLERDIRSATSLTVPTSIDGVYKYNALFSRINFSLNNTYILNLTGRRDGSSRFGSENQFHNFGAVGGAWIITQEKFLQSSKSWLSFGKLRASFGTTGNDQIGDYTYLDLYNAVSNAVPYQTSSSIAVNKIPNPYLQWEETRKLSLGLSLGFINDRILVDASFNRNRSSNQLISYSLPITAGFADVYKNLPATVQNISWEFSLNSINIKQKNFIWETSFNLTIPKNELVSFPGIEQTTLFNTYVVGQPLGIVKAYHYLGVDPASGVYQFSDRNGNKTFSPTFDDQIALINTDPKWYGGFQNSFRFKGIEISALFQFVKQRQSSLSLLNFGNGSQPGTASLNQPAWAFNRWQKTGDNASVQKYTTSFAAYTPWANASQSDAGAVDASFVRLKNITASYLLKGNFLSKGRVNQSRLFVEGQNLLTITKFKGLDPENQSNASIPPLRVVAVGINVQF